MKRKLLAITLTLAMLASLFSVASLSVSAAVNLGKAVNSVDDLPESVSLIAGKTPTMIGDTSKVPNTQANKTDWHLATDGKIQGVNQDLRWKITDSPTYTHNSTQYMQPKVPAEWIKANRPDLDATRDWYWAHDYWTGLPDFSLTRVTTWTSNSNDPRPVYDMGASAQVEQILLATSYDIGGTGAIRTVSTDGTSTITTTAEKLNIAPARQGLSEGTKNAFYKVNVYVADTNDANITNAENLVLSYDNTGSIANMSYATLYDVDTVKTGRYICFDFQYSGYSDLMRISEMGVYGVAKYDGFTRESISSEASLPDSEMLNQGMAPLAWNYAVDVQIDNAITGADHGTYLPPNHNGANSFISMASFGKNSRPDTLTNGKFSPATKPAYVVTSDATTTYSGTAVKNIPITFGENAGKYWKVNKDGNAFIDYSDLATRFWGTSDGNFMFFDLGSEDSIVEQFVLASAMKVPAFTPAQAPNSQEELDELLTTAVTDSYGGTYFNNVEIYVSNSLDDLFGAVTVKGVYKADGTLDSSITTFGDPSKTNKYSYTVSNEQGLANLITLDEPVKGRYVGFKLAPIPSKLFSEMAVYGRNPVTTYMSDELTASIPSPDSNILKNAIKGWERASNRNATVNDKMTSVLADGIVNLTDKVAPSDATAEYFYFTYDLETAYDITSLYYAGDGSTGANSVGVYVGDYTCTEIDELGLEPDYFYDGGIGNDFVSNNKTGAQAVRFDFNEAMTGRYVTFRLGTCKNGGQQVWVGEFAATGTPVTINTAGAQLRNATATDNYAVRFGFHMATDSIGYADADPKTSNNYARAELTADSKTTVNGKAVQVVEFGAVVSNLADITADGLTLEACSDESGSKIKNVPAKNLYAVKDGYLSYTAVIKSIPAAYKDADLYARPYITYKDGDNTVTIYGDMFTACVSDYIVTE